MKVKIDKEAIELFGECSGEGISGILNNEMNFEEVREMIYPNFPTSLSTHDISIILKRVNKGFKTYLNN